MTYALPAQLHVIVLQLEYLKKSMVFGAEFIWKMEKFLESLIDIEQKINGQKNGKS